MKEIRHLNLKGNRVTTIVADYFFGLDSLQELDLSDNRVQVEEADNEFYCSASDDKIVRPFLGGRNHPLIMISSPSQAIDSHAFCYVPKVINITLAGNCIEHIHSDFLTPLCPMTNVTKLELQRNQIGYHHEIELCSERGHNQIDYSFFAVSRTGEISTGTKGAFRAIMNLKELNLAWNRLQRLHPLHFRALKNLSSLNLKGCVSHTTTINAFG